MNFFESCLLRLKQTAKVTTDQEVAQMLGITKAALSDRKRRDSFPEDKLRALAHQRPEMGIDVDYVLTGTTEAESLRQRDALHEAGGIPKAQRDANRAEVELLTHYRACPTDVREALRKVISYCASSTPAAATTGGVRQHSSGDNNIQIGSAGGGVRIKKK